jgi:hypothetical protein
LSRDDAVTQSYCSPEAIDSMHKVVLHVKGQAQLLTLANKLTDAGVVHKLWMEQVCTRPRGSMMRLHASTLHSSSSTRASSPAPFVRSMRPPLTHRTDEFTHRGLSVPKPENFPTALATKPYVKEDVAVHFKKCQLAK